MEMLSNKRVRQKGNDRRRRLIAFRLSEVEWLRLSNHTIVNDVGISAVIRNCLSPIIGAPSVPPKRCNDGIGHSAKEEAPATHAAGAGQKVDRPSSHIPIIQQLRIPNLPIHRKRTEPPM